jgi:HEAT repeat protein
MKYPPRFPVSYRREVSLIAALTSLLVFASPRSSSATEAGQEAPPITTLIAWLDDPSTAWIATAWIQKVGPAAVPALLTPGAVTSGPHGRLGPRMLALAKIGEAAIPTINARLSDLMRAPDREDLREESELIRVLGAIGSSSIPTLIEFASTSRSAVTKSRALEEIVRLEPRTSFGFESDPWRGWHPLDDQLQRIEQQIVPALDRIQEMVTEETSSDQPYRWSGAYLLARWGSGDRRTLGIRVLTEAAMKQPFYRAFEIAELLYRVQAPGIAQLLRHMAAELPQGGLSDQSRLRVAVALSQIGDRDCVELLLMALHSKNEGAVTDGIRFAGSSGDLRLVPPLIELLANKTETGAESISTIGGKVVRKRITIADLAVEALQGLTLQSIGVSQRQWLTWWRGNRGKQQRDLVLRFVEKHVGRMKTVPIWVANGWIKKLARLPGAGGLRLLRIYLERPDLDSSKVGPTASEGGLGPLSYLPAAPPVVTILLRNVQMGNNEARGLLGLAMESKDMSVRLSAALAVGSFDWGAASDHLTKELASADNSQRDYMGDFLLSMKDSRAIPILIDRLDSDYEASRFMACFELRLYTQQPIPCDAKVDSTEREANQTLWREWWGSTRGFEVKSHEAELDRLASPEVTPLTVLAGVKVARAAKNDEPGQ